MTLTRVLVWLADRIENMLDRLGPPPGHPADFHAWAWSGPGTPWEGEARSVLRDLEHQDPHLACRVHELLIKSVAALATGA